MSWELSVVNIVFCGGFVSAVPHFVTGGAVQRADTVSMAAGPRGGSAGIDGRARGRLLRGAGSL